MVMWPRLARPVQPWLRYHRMPSSLGRCILVPSSLSSSALPPLSSLSTLFSAGSRSTSPASSFLRSPQTSGSRPSAGAGASRLAFASLIFHSQVKGTLPCILPWLRPKLVYPSSFPSNRQCHLHEVPGRLGSDMLEWH